MTGMEFLSVPASPTPGCSGPRASGKLASEPHAMCSRTGHVGFVPLHTPFSHSLADLITAALKKKSSLPKSLENVVVLSLAEGCLQMSLIQGSQREVIPNNPGEA